MIYKKIKENILYAGMNDEDRLIFDELIPLDHGTSYNSYIVIGNEKTAVIDTMYPKFTKEYLKSLDKQDYELEKQRFGLALKEEITGLEFLSGICGSEVTSYELKVRHVCEKCRQMREKNGWNFWKRQIKTRIKNNNNFLKILAYIMCT